MVPFYITDVKRFHDKFGMTTPAIFCGLPEDLQRFRSNFFREELEEYIESYASGDLGTAIDSLVDLIYITCGTALLHGIPDSETWEEAMLNVALDDKLLYAPHGDVNAKLGFVERELHEDFIAKMQASIAAYDEACKHDSEGATVQALMHLYSNVFVMASDMGMTEDCWDDFWSDVQRANMTKERALKPEDSKRGSAWDVIKPPGWEGPRTAELLEKWAA